MSKRASLTLRKPSAPSAADIEAFVEAAEEPEPEAVASPALASVPPAAEPVSADSSAQEGPARTPHPEDDVVVFRRPHKSNILRKKGMRRRTTVYFEFALAKELAHHCIDRDMEMSDVVNEAVRVYLAHDS